MKLSYGQLEAVLAGHLRIHPDKVPTLRSRLKQLQRLKFPPGVNVGRGAKMEYSGEHLFLLVTVFELIANGLPAQFACSLTVKHWNEFRAGYALAALQGRDLSNGDDDQILAVLTVQNLHEIQFQKHGRKRPSYVHIYDLGAVQSSLRPYSFFEVFTRVFISIGLLTTRILDIAASRAGVEGISVWSPEFHDWLPVGAAREYSFANPYPDRSNIAMRTRLHQYFGNDPDALTAVGIEEAEAFKAADYSKGSPL